MVMPQTEEAAEAAREAVSCHRTLIMVGRCRVHYAGRASSTLEPGERMLVVKADGSLLVHRSLGYEPVNWQPPGCVFHVSARGGAVEVHAVRQKPSESVRVVFDEVRLLSSFSLADSGEFSLHASEEDMQKAILQKPEILEEGFKPISYEKKVAPGFVDVYGVDRQGRFVVVEIKRKTAGKDAAMQLSKYIEAVRARANRTVRGILVAPSIAKDVQRLLATLELEYKYLDPKKCSEILRQAETRKLAEYFSEE